MLIEGKKANIKKVGPMEIREYKINKDYSGALIEINGDHGRTKSLKEDRIYFILGGDGVFEIDGRKLKVNKNDLIFIPANMGYNIIGKLKYFLVCSPEFNTKNSVSLKD